MADHVALGEYAGGSRLKVNWQTVIGWVVAALLAYGAVEARVRVLEFQQGLLAEDVREIKSDIKTLLRWVPLREPVQPR